jgi:CubicO group peptidase (beta-lactamase class C family)
MRTRTSLLYSILLLAASACGVQETSTALERSIPEREGVNSAGIIDFLDAVEQSDHEFHSFLFLRHGKVIAEGWWDPYGPDLKHTLYSTSKSFTSTAIGLAVSEGLISVEDKVISFFPEDLPDTVSPYLADLTIRDVISMTTGQDPDPTGAVLTDSNWVAAFLATPIVNEPGSVFLYNTLGTYMLSAVISEVTGETVLDYLTPRLFDPLGITGVDWEVDPQGRNTGGWGLRVKTEDMAKFGQLYLQHGMWRGEQILPASWVEEATTASILQSPEVPQSVRDSSDWLQGYGYQFWRCRNNAFRADGAFGQFIIVLPDQDAVVVITSESADMQGEINLVWEHLLGEINLVWEHLLPAMQDEPLQENSEMEGRLEQRLATLALPLPETVSTPPIASDISGRTYSTGTNDRGVDSLSFRFSENVVLVTMNTEDGEFSLEFGEENWRYGETTRRGPYLLYGARAAYVGLPPLRIAGAYGWEDERTLRLVLRYIESPHTETLICRFLEDRLAVTVIHSFAPPPSEPTLEGVLTGTS